MQRFLSPCWRVTFFACPKKVTKKRAPSHHGLRLPCVAQQSGRPSKLALAACKKRKPPRNSNRRWPTTPTSSPLLSVMGWDSSRQTYIDEIWTVQKPDSFSFFNAPMVALIWCSGSPSDAPSNAGLAGVLGHRLSESRSSSRFL